MARKNDGGEYIRDDDEDSSRRDDGGRPPRRPRRTSYDDDENDDYEDRPRRRRPISSDDSWLDQQFANTNIAVLVLFGLCCGWIALVFSIVGVAACNNPTAKQNALVVLIVSIIASGLSALVIIGNSMNNPGFR